MKWYLVKEGSGTSWRESALFLVFVQLYRKESTPVEKKERVTGLPRGEGFQEKVMGDWAGSAPADRLKGPAGFVCVWPEHMWR